MEYKKHVTISADLGEFWEDKKNNSFGLRMADGKNITVKKYKNTIKIETQGIKAQLHREGKVATVSAENKTIKGNIKAGDKLYLDEGVIIEFVKTVNVNWNKWIAIVILLALLIIVFLGWKKNRENNTENNYQMIAGEISDLLTKSDNIKSIDPETSLKLLNEAKNKLEKITTNKKHEAEILEIEKNIGEKLAVSGSTEIVSFTEIYDTQIADTVDRKYDRLSLSGEVAVLGQSDKGKIIEINLSSGQVSKFDVESQVKNIIDLILVKNKVFVYDGENILGTNLNKEVTGGKEVYIKIGYWNSSWYFLTTEGKIKKFSGGEIKDWTSAEAELLSNPVDMTIDGTVWVVGQNGNVINYEKGTEKKWTPSIKINENILGITTTGDSEKIAIISDKKVYIFEKNGGKLIATHNFEKIGIIAAKMGNNSQIFVLGADQKIYKVK